MSPDEIDEIMTLTRELDELRTDLDYMCREHSDDVTGSLGGCCTVMLDALLAERRYDVIKQALGAYFEHRARTDERTNT